MTYKRWKVSKKLFSLTEKYKDYCLDNQFGVEHEKKAVLFSMSIPILHLENESISRVNLTREQAERKIASLGKEMKRRLRIYNKWKRGRGE